MKTVMRMLCGVGALAAIVACARGHREGATRPPSTGQFPPLQSQRSEEKAGDGGETALPKKATLEPSVAAAVATFGSKLVKELGAKGGNVAVSPLGLHMALSMVLSGATGASQLELGELLGVPSSPEALIEAYARTLTAAKDSKGIHIKARLDLADALRPGDAWVSDLERGFGAPLVLNNFEKEASEATRRIDAWFNNETGGRIPELFGKKELNEGTRLVASSAVVFERNWANRFRVIDTVVHPFVLADGSQVVVPTLRGERVRMGFTRVAQADATSDFPAVGVGVTGPYWAALPFEGEEFVLLVGLPRSTALLPELEHDLESPGVASILAKLEYQNVEVLLPKVDWLTPSLELDGVLLALGFRNMYADLTLGRAGLPSNTVLSRALQRVRVSWDEEGAEFAAASSVSGAVGIGATAAAPLAFDHPFVFALVHNSTGLVLVQGRVMSPLKY
jgi:serine protease inhibitor